MGLFQKAVETFDCHQHLAGISQAGREPLAPIAHWVTTANIEITINADGGFLSAKAVDKNEPKIIIPVTEASVGRTKAAAKAPHPLCDKLSYFVPYNSEKRELYLTKLQEWKDSDYSHPKLEAVYQYVREGSILQDLEQADLIHPSKGKLKEKEEDYIICWNIVGADPNKDSACWRDQDLFRAFTQYYESLLISRPKDLCMISGDRTDMASSHVRGVVPTHGMAKLISSNDDSNVSFTFLGRFTDKRQAATIGYEASQKAHNALHWLVTSQGVAFGKRTFLCWNPQGIEVCTATGPFRLHTQKIIKPSDYQEDLKKTLSGYRTTLTPDKGVVIAAFDAATSGRLSLTYYNELTGSDFLERLYQWDRWCCWYNGRFGIQAPSLYQIASCACGIEHTEKGTTKLKVKDEIMRQQMQRLVSCRIDQARMPADLKKLLVNRASTPQAFEPDNWKQVLFVACAVMHKYYYDTKGWDIMAWTLNTENRSFQYGRLLAMMDWAERQYYRKTNKKTDEERQSNALKALSEFRRRPFQTYERVNRQLEHAYLPRVDGWARAKYERQRDEIMGILSTFPAAELGKPLDDIYLMGYSLQRNELYKKAEKSSDVNDKSDTENDKMEEE